MSKIAQRYCCMKCKCDGSTTFYSFPTNSDRRQLWLRNCRRVRPDFTPTKSHRLCSKHFDCAQFESHREDGLRKLRPNAVPLFFESSPPLFPTVAPKKIKMEEVTQHDEHQYSTQCHQLLARSTTVDNTNSDVALLHVEAHNSTQSEPPSNNLLPSLDTDTNATATQHNQSLDKLKELQLTIRRLTWQLQQSKQREENLLANITKFLNADQIEKLKRSPNSKGCSVTWSSETIQRCLAIRSVVGRNGYKYLRTLKFPLPSYRTLCRRRQNVPFAPGIQHDVLHQSSSQ